MNEAIKTENLTKHFGPVRAVEDLSLNIGKGEIYGFLGLNGAGKTTTIRMLLGMVHPSSGIASISGRKVSPGDHGLWEKVGYMVEIPYSYPELTVRENLEIIRRLRSLKDVHAVSRIIAKLHLEEYADRKVRNLSQGNAQRLGLAKALIHHPEILMLDEPANGLDPAGIAEIRKLLIDMAVNHGVTIFISSHILDEVSKFSTRIGIIHKGFLIQETDTEKLDRLRMKKLIVDAANKTKLKKILEQHGFTVALSEDGVPEINDETAIRQPEMIASLLVQEGMPPRLLKVEEENLESYFLRMIGKEGGGK